MPSWTVYEKGEYVRKWSFIISLRCYFDDSCQFNEVAMPNKNGDMTDIHEKLLLAASCQKARGPFLFVWLVCRTSRRDSLEIYFWVRRVPGIFSSCSKIMLVVCAHTHRKKRPVPWLSQYDNKFSTSRLLKALDSILHVKHTLAKRVGLRSSCLEQILKGSWDWN